MVYWLMLLTSEHIMWASMLLLLDSMFKVDLLTDSGTAKSLFHCSFIGWFD